MDKLDTLIKDQTKLMERLGVLKLPSSQLGRHSNNFDHLTADTMTTSFALLDEVHEFARELNWKPWKKTKKEVDLRKVQLELIDAFHFMLELMIIWGLDANQIFELYQSKLAENHKRQDGGY